MHHVASARADIEHRPALLSPPGVFIQQSQDRPCAGSEPPVVVFLDLN